MPDITGPVTRLAASSYDPHAVTPFFALWDDGREAEDPGKLPTMTFVSDASGDARVIVGDQTMSLSAEHLDALATFIADRDKPAPCCGDDCPCTTPVEL